MTDDGQTDDGRWTDGRRTTFDLMSSADIVKQLKITVRILLQFLFLFFFFLFPISVHYHIYYVVHYNSGIMQRREVRSLLEIGYWAFKSPTSNKEMNTGVNYRHCNFHNGLSGARIVPDLLVRVFPTVALSRNSILLQKTGVLLRNSGIKNPEKNPLL